MHICDCPDDLWPKWWDLKQIAATKGVTVTPNGYKATGRRYVIEDWGALFSMIDGYDAMARQVERWLRGVRP